MTRRLLTLPEFRHWFIGVTDPRTGKPIEDEDQGPYDFETADDDGPSDFACDQSPRILYEIIKNVEFTGREWNELVDTLYSYLPEGTIGEDDIPSQTELFSILGDTGYDHLYDSGFLSEWPIYLDLSTSRKMVEWASYRWDNLAPLPEPWTPA